MGLTLFQFTHPGRGATQLQYFQFQPMQVSIHAPREGCDRSLSAVSAAFKEFQFTHPGRGATFKDGVGNLAGKFQFTHPGRGATKLCAEFLGCFNVSIHAPRGGCDLVCEHHIGMHTKVSIHAPREGCDAVPLSVTASVH